MRRASWWVLCGLLPALVALPWLPVSGQAWLQGLVELVAVVVLWVGFLPRRDIDRPGWAAVAVGISLLAAQDLTTPLAQTIGHPLSAGLAGGLVVPGYVVLAAGIGRVLVRGWSTTAAGGGWTETCVLGLGSLAPLLSFFVLPALANSPAPATGVAVIVYAVFACGAVVMLARMSLFDGGFSVSLMCLSACTASSVAGCVWSVSHGGDGMVADSAVVRMLWALSYVLAAAGISHRSLGDLTHGHTRGPSVGRKVGVLGVGLLLPSLSMVLDLAIGDGVVGWVQPVLVVAVSLAVVGRMAALTWQLSYSTAQLELVARSDELTGLPNRRGWQYHLAAACSVAERTGASLGVAVIAVDNFAAFNAVQGPASGDRFLRRLTADWSAALHEGEVLARFGGVQFAVLLPGLDLAAARDRVDALRTLVPTPETASAGVTVWNPRHDSDAALLEADSALYLALCDGGNRTVTADPDAHVLPGPLRDLQTAVQPIVRLADDATVAVECLSRFPHTTAIETVFADAHEKGFGDLLEVTAISRVLALPDRPSGLDVYVNVSERAARSTRFWAELPRDLTGVVVELVEQRDGLSDAEILRVFDRFRAMGARVALDDVGSSSTDFARIAALRPDVAKIDRSLVAGCDANPSQVEVLRMLVGFARDHGAEVVVEGVETSGELEVARLVGATYAQGYLLGRPSTPWQESLAHRPPATRNVVPVT